MTSVYHGTDKSTKHTNIMTDAAKEKLHSCAERARAGRMNVIETNTLKSDSIK